MWNPLFTSESGCMLGTRPRLAWGPLAAGPSKSLKAWSDFCSLPEVEREALLVQYKGGHIMYQDIQ